MEDEDDPLISKFKPVADRARAGETFAEFAKRISPPELSHADMRLLERFVEGFIANPPESIEAKRDIVAQINELFTIHKIRIADARGPARLRVTPSTRSGALQAQVPGSKSGRLFAGPIRLMRVPGNFVGRGLDHQT